MFYLIWGVLKYTIICNKAFCLKNKQIFLSDFAVFHISEKTPPNFFLLQVIFGVLFKKERRSNLLFLKIYAIELLLKTKKPSLYIPGDGFHY